MNNLFNRLRVVVDNLDVPRHNENDYVDRWDSNNINIRVRITRVGKHLAIYNNDELIHETINSKYDVCTAQHLFARLQLLNIAPLPAGVDIAIVASKAIHSMKLRKSEKLALLADFVALFDIKEK